MRSFTYANVMLAMLGLAACGADVTPTEQDYIRLRDDGGEVLRYWLWM